MKKQTDKVRVKVVIFLLKRRKSFVKCANFCPFKLKKPCSSENLLLQNVYKIFLPKLWRELREFYIIAIAFRYGDNTFYFILHSLEKAIFTS